MLTVDELISRVEIAIDFGLDVQRNKKDLTFIPRSKIWKSNISNLGGMSTKEVRILLNSLVKEDTNYLEIGLYKGSTFISALFENNPKNAYAIDSYKQFENESGDDILKAFLKNCESYKISNFTLIRNDAFNLTNEQKQDIKDINLYFYDGGHSYRDHYMALRYYYENLNKIFILIVDDWIHPDAEYGTNFAIENLKLKVHKQWILGKSQHVKSSELNWHNGLYIAVLEK
jgi:precorrin-6B methylase 2